MPLASPPDQWLEIDGLATRYWSSGEGTPPMLLLHGIGGSVEAWHRNFAVLAQRHRVAALDLPGCGRTSPPPSYPRDTLGLFAEFVHRFVEATQSERPILIGSSLGGAVAIEYALRFPTALRGLVLIGASGFTSKVNWALRLASVPLLGERLTRPGRDATAAALRGLVADGRVVTDDEIDAAYTLAQLPGAQAAFLHMLRVYCNVFGIRRQEVRRILASLSTIPHPTLLMWGERDRILPVNSAFEALVRLPNARMVVLEGCGHVPFVEAAPTVNQLLGDFAHEVAASRFTPTFLPVWLQVGDAYHGRAHNLTDWTDTDGDDV